MKNLNRATVLAVLLVLGSMSLPAMAQTGGQDTGVAATPEVAEATKKEKKQQAKEARITEYLRKKEEKRARRELAAESSAEAAETAAQTAQAAPSTANASPEPPARRQPNRRAQRQRAPQLPRGLARAQKNVRNSVLAADPTVIPWLDKIDRQEASPHMLAEFGTFVAENGMIQDAMEYYSVALSLEPDDPNLWVNMGILHSKRGDTATAAKAFERALGIDQNNSRGHYNLGAAYDEMDRYEDAIQEYKWALTLDPALGDPSVNPQAANNRLLLAVKLMLYREQQGSLGLPMQDVPNTENDRP